MDIFPIFRFCNAVSLKYVEISLPAMAKSDIVKNDF